MAEPPMEPASQENNQRFAQLIAGDEVRRKFLAAAAAAGTSEANKFFDSFAFVLNIFQGNPGAGLSQGIELLGACQKADPQAYKQIHKGTPFYWLGIAAFLVHDYELATFFFDAAAAEDIRAGAGPDSVGTPAHRFILMEGENTAQAALELTRLTQARVQEQINSYNARAGRPVGVANLTIDEVRQYFLRRAVSSGGESLRSLATAFISFVLEWDYRSTLLDLRPGTGTAEPIFLHLFKGCVLFESLLKANPRFPPTSGTTSLGDALKHLHAQLGIPSKVSIGGMNFPGIVSSLASADESIQTAILFAGRVRNTVGHNLGWAVSMDKNHYSRLYQMISSACLHTIASTYR